MLRDPGKGRWCFILDGEGCLDEGTRKQGEEAFLVGGVGVAGVVGSPGRVLVKGQRLRGPHSARRPCQGAVRYHGKGMDNEARSPVCCLPAVIIPISMHWAACITTQIERSSHKKLRRNSSRKPSAPGPTWCLFCLYPSTQLLAPQLFCL